MNRHYPSGHVSPFTGRRRRRPPSSKAITIYTPLFVVVVPQCHHHVADTFSIVLIAILNLSDSHSVVEPFGGDGQSTILDDIFRVITDAVVPRFNSLLVTITFKNRLHFISSAPVTGTVAIFQ